MNVSVKPEPMDLFDCNCMLGRWQTATPGSPTTAEELVAELGYYGIGSALVYHATAANSNPEKGNRRLLTDVANQPALHPAWVLIPEETGEMGPEGETVRAMLSAGVRAAWMFPHDWRFALRVWNTGDLLAGLTAHRIPLFIDFGQRHWDTEFIDWDGIFETCSTFASLPVILARADLNSNRRLFPLMARFPNLYIEMSYYVVHRGIELVCNRFGADRVLFGSGIPVRPAGPAISMLAYSQITDEEKALVAGGNLRRLLEGVRP